MTMITYLRRLIASWSHPRPRGRHRHQPYLDTAAAALSWDAPPGIDRDVSVTIDPENGVVLACLSRRCSCGCGGRCRAIVELPVDRPPELVRAVLDVAAAAFGAAMEGGSGEGRRCGVIDTTGFGVG